MNQDNAIIDLESQKHIFIKFESKIYPIIIPKETVTMKQLKDGFCQDLMQTGVFIDPAAYELKDEFGKRVLGEEETIQDILEESQFLQLIKIFVIEKHLEQNFDQHWENYNNEDLKYDQQIEKQHLLKIPVTYRNYFVLLEIHNEPIEMKTLKKKIIMELQDLNIIVNEHFCVISNLREKNKMIDPKLLLDGISLVDIKEQLLKQSNICLFDQKSFRKEFLRQNKKNKMFNIKIAIECQNLKEKSCFKIFPFIKNQNFSRIYFIGPQETPYSNGIYELISRIPENYPYEPPQFYFNTNIYHPNIINGKIALVELERTWNPVSTFQSAIQLIISYLSEPNLECIIDQEAGEQYLSDKDSFHQKAEEFKNKFANPELDDIIETLIGKLPRSDPLYCALLDEFEEWIIHWVHQSR